MQEEFVSMTVMRKFACTADDVVAGLAACVLGDPGTDIGCDVVFVQGEGALAPSLLISRTC